MHSVSEVFGEPESWHFDYQYEVLQTAFWIWSMSGFKHLPNQDEVMQYDPRYISDMKLLHTIYAHQGSENNAQKMVDEFVTKENALRELREMRGEPEEPTNQPRLRTSFQKREPKVEQYVY